MNGPVFPILKASPAVTALLGFNPCRVFPWGEAPEGVEKPYATYGTFNGNPENYLAGAPDTDRLGTQIDIWAMSSLSCTSCFEAIRDALQPHGHMTGFQAADRDRETKLFHARMEFDFWEAR